MVDLSEIKSRMEREKERKEEQEVTLPSPSKVQEPPSLRPDTLKQVKEYMKAAEELQRQQEAQVEKVDLGPTPENAKSLVEPEDPTFYRNTHFDNKKVRTAVEAQCREMDFADLVLTGRVNQVVPVIPGKLVLEFQSLTGADSYWIENNAQMEAQTEWGLKSWVLWAQLTMSLVSMNGKAFPNHLGKDGEVDSKLFKEKQVKIMRLGAKILDIAATNMNWFNERVDKILQNDFEQLGNG